MTELQGDRPVYELSPEGLAKLRDVFDRARDGFRETFYCWDNRLLRQEVSFPEHYLNSRIAIVCQLSSAAGRVMVFVSHRQPVQVNAVNYGHKGDVLVPDIQVVDCEEEIIPSFVWPYRVENEVSDALGEGLYWSAVTSTAYILLCNGIIAV